MLGREGLLALAELRDLDATVVVASWKTSTAGRCAISPCSSRNWRTGLDSSSCGSGTRPSGACSTSLTLVTSTAWCAVIARPHSVTMRGGTSPSAAQASASGCTMLEA